MTVETAKQEQMESAAGYTPGTFNHVWQQMINSSLSNQDKGKRFELLILHYLKAHPSWNEMFSDVKLWVNRNEIEGWDDNVTGTLGHGDIGVDIVAKFAQSEEGESDWMAIQCKFSSDDSKTLPKKQVESFLNESRFARQRILATIKTPSSNVMKQLMQDDKPVTVLDLDMLRQAKFYWATLEERIEKTRYTGKPYEILDHQKEAIDSVIDHCYTNGNQRAQIHLPCGSGKTFTALKLAEKVAGIRSRKDEPVRVLYLMPSISLLAQNMREWSEQRQGRMRHRYIGVCSDRTSGKHREDEFGTLSELQGEVTTNPDKIVARMKHKYRDTHLLVVFSTYQSSHLIKEAQKQGAPKFDLVICDEAHRTSGLDIPGEETSNFLLVHDDNHIRADKRLYMTATPRIYLDAAKTKASKSNSMLYSMDDTTKFGEIAYEMGFDDAIAKELLTDYAILTVAIDPGYQKLLRESGALPKDPAMEDFAIKAIGTAKALAGDGAKGDSWDILHKSIAFTNRVKESKSYAEYLPTTSNIVSILSGDPERFKLNARHIDGTHSSAKRRADLDWLVKPSDDGSVKVLCNARCLSEGVDVPALDAVVFLSPKEATIDIIQQVGRVMRRAEGKEKGYVVVPLLLEDSIFTEEGITKSGDYRTLIKVAKALKSHDKRMKDMLNFKDLTNVQVRHITPSDADIDRSKLSEEEKEQLRWTIGNITGDLVEAVKVSLYSGASDKEYWKNWAIDIGEQTQKLQEEVLGHLEQTENREAYDKFLEGARQSLSANMSDKEAVSFLAQYIVTKPVFEALYSDYDFAGNNDVARILNTVCEELEANGMPLDISEKNTQFYDSVRKHVESEKGKDTKYELVKELYETFLTTAFPEETKKLGVVYTPTEIVDWLIKSADDILRSEFKKSLEAPGVEILDPFTGAGTFPVRMMLLEHNGKHIISDEALTRKYDSEINAIDIMPTAYFIADISMEEAYHKRIRQAVQKQGKDPSKVPYRNFDGIALGDTFLQPTKPNPDGHYDNRLFGIEEGNTRQLNKIASRPITVIIGNPPWRASQDDVTEGNPNDPYPKIDALIKDSYVSRSTASVQNALYDLYIKSLRWASDRIGDEGVLAMVINGGWLDGAAANGVRACLEEEFNKIYVYNLKGNLRGGEAEGGNVFDVRVGITMLVLVKHKNQAGKGKIYYHESPENYSKEDKLNEISQSSSLQQITWDNLIPDKNFDWINQRDEHYKTYLPIGSASVKSLKSNNAVFRLYSMGLKSNRDLWAYDSNQDELEDRSVKAVNFYNSQVDIGSSKNLVVDPSIFKWNGGSESAVKRGHRIDGEVYIRKAAFRPFFPQYLHYDKTMNHSHYKLDEIFPRDIQIDANATINISTKGASAFDALMTTEIPEHHLTGGGCQTFSRYQYTKLSDLRDRQNAERTINFDDKNTSRSRISTSWSSSGDVPIRETGISENQTRGYL